jgi:Zn-dependent peptidase ImmA (M78 family)
MTLRNIAKLTNQVHKFFPLMGTPSVIPIHHLQDMCITRAMLDDCFNDDFLTNIEIRDVDSESNGFAMFRNYNNKNVVISVCANRYCWKRFLITKEIGHAFLDKDMQHHTPDVIQLINDIVSGKLRINLRDLTIDTEINSEYLTILFAFELLVPYRFNYMLEEDDIVSYDIADTFKLPEAIVDMCRDERYLELRKQAYESLKV